MKAALAAALVNFVWEGAAIGALAWLGFSLARTPRVRYVVGILALVLMAAAPLATAVFVASTARPLAISGSQPSQVSVVDSGATAGRGTVDGREPEMAAEGRWTMARLTNIDARLASAVLLVWIVGVAALSVRLALGFAGARRLTNRVTAVGAEVQAVATRLIAALNIRSRVRVVESVFVRVPAVVGAFKPVVLLPAAAMSGLSMDQLEALLAHELAHVRRHDYLVNLLQSAVETLLFYHPAVWLVSRRVRQERELCCDDLALAVCNDRIAYASALADLESLRALPSPALAANGGSLLARVRRILGHDELSALSGRSRSVAGVAILASIVLLAGGQAARARAVDSAAKADDPRRAEWTPTPPQVSQPKPAAIQGVVGGVQGGVVAGVPGGVKVGVVGGTEAEVQGGIAVTQGNLNAQRFPGDGVLVGVGDDLVVSVLSPGSQDQFSERPRRVQSDGTIVLPGLSQPQKVGGLTVHQARQAIRQALINARQFADPFIEISIVRRETETQKEIAPEAERPTGPPVAVGHLVRLEVTVGVIRQMEFNKDYTVQPDGTIQVPYVGAVRAAGLAASALQESIAAALVGKGTLPGAKVVASLEGRSSSDSVWVIGEVKSPGAYPWRAGFTVEQMLTLAGGQTPRASVGKIHLLETDAPIKLTDAVVAGSTIEVPMMQNVSVTVQGAIRNPGSFPLREDRNTVSDAISSAGGFQTSAGSRIWLKRKGAPDITLSKADVVQGRSASLKLLDGDTVTVEVAPHFYVTGYVKNSAAEFNWEPGVTLAKAIAMAGGASPEGALNRIEISRKDPKTGKFVKAPLDKDRMATLIEPDDVIKVPRKVM